MKKKSTWISFLYILIGSCWLIFGNRLINEIDRNSPNRDLSYLYDYKNILFVIFSGFILFIILEIYKKNLSVAEEGFNQLFEGAPAVIYLIAKSDLRFLKVNQVMVNKYGYSEEELLKMTAKEIRSDEDAERLETYLKEDHQEGHETGIWLHKHKNGEEF